MSKKRIPVTPVILVGLVIVVMLLMWAGNSFQPLRSTDPPFQIRYDMYYQTKVSAQQPSTFFADRKAMRNPVPGTIPRDGYLYGYETPEEAEANADVDINLLNPFPAATEAVLARGRNRYEAFCSPCHSVSGQDTTEVVKRGMQKPPSLASSKAKSYSDVKMYHIISRGQNIMPGYADKLTPDDRWAVVAHVRELQKAPLKYPEIPAPAPADTSKPAAASK